MSAGIILRNACLAAAGLLAGCGGGSSDPPPPKPTTVYLFPAAKHDCNLGGRTGADAIAAAALPAALAGKKVHAFLSVSATDDIASMPATYGFPADIPVKNPDGSFTLAENWAGLLTGGLPQVLDDTIAVDPGEVWWSGSHDDGTVAASTCTAWTDGSARAEVGLTSSVGPSWMDVGGDYPGLTQAYVLGIAY